VHPLCSYTRRTWQHGREHEHIAVVVTGLLCWLGVLMGDEPPHTHGQLGLALVQAEGRCSDCERDDN
jgi:hypothetical protein